MSEIVSTNHQLDKLISPLCNQEARDAIYEVLSTSYLDVVQQTNIFLVQEKSLKKEIKILKNKSTSLSSELDSINGYIEHDGNLITRYNEDIKKLNELKNRFEAEKNLILNSESEKTKNKNKMSIFFGDIIAPIAAIGVYFKFFKDTERIELNLLEKIILSYMLLRIAYFIFELFSSKKEEISKEKLEKLKELEDKYNEEYQKERKKIAYYKECKIDELIDDTHERIGRLQNSNAKMREKYEISINDKEKIDSEIIILESKLAELEAEKRNFFSSEAFKQITYYPREYVEAIKKGSSIYFDLTIEFLNTRQATTLADAFKLVKEEIYRYQDEVKHQDLLTTINNQTKTLKEEIFQLSESTIQLLEKSRQSDINIHSAISALQQAKAAARSAEISSDAAATAAIAANYAMHIARNN